MNRKSIVSIVLVVLCVAIAAGFWLRNPRANPLYAVELPRPCRETTFERVAYVICEIDLREFEVGVFHAGADGKPYSSLESLDKSSAGRSKPIVLSMNAGMYHADLSPVGLLIEEGRELSPVETADGEGNFFLKPNGIFLIERSGEAAVMATGVYLAARPNVRFATQSGPMLVIDGNIHPSFLPDGTSRFTRNGIGVRDANTVILAISLSEVSLGSFARLFRDALRCPNALFLDGAISSLSNGRKTLLGGAFPVGPILAVWERT